MQEKITQGLCLRKTANRFPVKMVNLSEKMRENNKKTSVKPIRILFFEIAENKIRNSNS